MSIGKLLCVGVIGAAVVASLPREDFETRERRRIQTHFDSALVGLRSRDVRVLSWTQQANRASLVRTLEAYRDRGAFPHNYDVPDRAVPSFVDTKTGVRCAVGHLMESTGRMDMVARIARANLHVYAIDLAADTAVASWLEANGLTAAEAAGIQPKYQPVDDPPRSYEATGTVMALSLASATLAIANLASNTTGKNRALTVAGAGIGAFTALVALQAGRNTDAPEGVALLGLVSGATSAVVSAATLFAKTPGPASRMRIAPTIALPRVESPRLGVSGRVRF